MIWPVSIGTLPKVGAPAKLVTIPISHYCEKARWALDRCGVAFVEHAHMQGVHGFVARRAGGGVTAPVLVSSDGVFTESAQIVDYADAYAPDQRRLYSTDRAVAAETRALEHDFDERLGPESRLWMYNGMRGQRGLILKYGTAGVPAWERRMLPLALGAMTRLIDRVLDVSPENAEVSAKVVRETFDSVAERLSDGRPYLMGGQFSAADITFSALAAAVLVPPEYAVRLPQPDELPPRMAVFVSECRAHPAGAHAMKMFRDERHA